MPFARAVLDLVEEMKRTRQGQPQLPQEVPSAFESFVASGWQNSDVWQLADLESVFAYLRHGKRLQIRSEWRAIVPATLV